MHFLKSACLDAMYTELPFLDRIHQAKKDGFDYIEFWGWQDKDIDAIQRITQDVDIKVSGFNGDATLSLIDPLQQTDYLVYLEESVKIAKKLSSKSVTIHSNGLGDKGRVIDPYLQLSDTTK